MLRFVFLCCVIVAVVTIVIACSGAPGPQSAPRVSAPPSPGDLDWLNATQGQAFERSSIRIELTKHGVGRVPLKSMGQVGESEDEHLMVVVKVTNRDAARLVDFRGWSSAGQSPALVDDLGNQYRPVRFGLTTEVLGQTASVSLYADKPVEDLLVFQRPVGPAVALFLRLPLSDAMGGGEARFKFSPPSK